MLRLSVKTPTIRLYEGVIDEDRDVRSKYFLAMLLEEGGNGVTHDLERAMGLYEIAIGEGVHVDLKKVTAFMVADSCNEVAQYVEWDVCLYERSIEESLEVTVMFNLVMLLERAERGEKAFEQAKCVYRRALD